MRAISDNYKMFMSQGIAIEVLEKELEDARSKLSNLTTYLDDLISKCAITYTSLESPNIKAEMLIYSDKHLPKDFTDKLILNCHL